MYTNINTLKRFCLTSFTSPGKLLIIFITFTLLSYFPDALATDLYDYDLHVIPYPQQVYFGGNDFSFTDEVTVVIDNNRTGSDRFTAEELVKDLKKEFNIDCKISGVKGDKSIVLTHQGNYRSTGNQDY